MGEIHIVEGDLESFAKSVGGYSGGTVEFGGQRNILA